MSRRADGALDEIARALRLVGEREAHHVVFEPARPGPRPSFIQFTTDPGVFWGEVVPDLHPTGRPRAGAGGAQRLEALGWRAPAGHIPNWFQYFHPTRKRHYRELAEHVLLTFRRGLRVPIGDGIVAAVDRGEPAAGPSFVVDTEAAAPVDEELLAIAAQVMSRFAPDVYDTHMEVTMHRRRHQVRIAVSACDGTLSCAALHLPAVLPELADAAFAVSDQLERVPYSYAIRTVTGHGESLVLLSKVRVLPELRNPPMVGLLLYSTVEPLVDAHRALHSAAG